MSIYKKVLALMMSYFLLLNPAYSGVGGVGFATEYTQLLNNIQMVNMVYQEAKGVQEQIRQYQTMIKNLASLPEYYRQDIGQLLGQLDTTAKRGLAISYNIDNLVEKYEQTYLNYDAFKEKAEEGEGPSSYENIYKKQTQASHDAIIASLSVAKSQMQNLSTETSKLQQLQTQASTAQGNLQVLQAATSIAAQQTTQLQQMRQLLATQLQMQANVMASEEAERAQRQAYMIESMTVEHDGHRAPIGHEIFNKDSVYE